MCGHELRIERKPSADLRRRRRSPGDRLERAEVRPRGADLVLLTDEMLRVAVQRGVGRQDHFAQDVP